MKIKLGIAFAFLLASGIGHASKMDTLELTSPKTFATLPSSTNGTILFCSDCTSLSPTTSGGTGTMVRRENGAWNGGVLTSPAGQTSVGTTRSLTAGSGLTGLGDLSANRTVNIGQNADNSIIINADDIQRAAISGDVAVPLGSNTATLPSIVAAGTNLKLTYNIKGQVTAGTTAACADLSDDGTACPLNTGTSIVAIGGALERVIKWQPQVSATSKVYTAADMGKGWSRTNGGVNMTDTLPTITAALDGFTMVNSNDDPTATNTISAAAGQFIVNNTGGPGATSFTQYWGARRTEEVAVWNGGTNPFWRVHQNNNNLVRGKSGTTFVVGNVPKVSSTSAPNGNEIDDSGFPAALATGAANGFLASGDFTKLSNTSGTNTGDFTLAAVGVSPNANGATRSSQVLNLELANASFPGLLSASGFTNLGNQSGTNSGNVSLTASGSSANANAATLVGQQIQLQQASTAFAGLMSSADKVKLNGKWKDAVADCGLTNAGAAQADTVWQNCVDSFSSTGGVLYFGSGTYDLGLTVAATITITKPIIFVGSGRSVAVIQISNATKTAFTLASGAAGFGMEQIRFSAPLSTTRTAGFALDMGTIANAYVQQIDCLFQWSCLHSGGALQFVDDVNFREGGANAVNGQFILIDGTGDRYIRRLTTDNPSDPTGFAGVRVREASSVVITDSNIINSTNALDVVPNAGGGHQVASVLVATTFFDSGVIGVNILPATNSDTAQRVRVVNSWFGSNTTANVRIGNGTIPNANIASVDFLGDDFFSNSTTPIGLDVQGATDWSVRGSRFCGHTTNAIKVGVGTGSADQRFSISDNLIANCMGAGANAQGITIGAGTYGQYQVLDNRGLDSNTTPGMVDNGSVGPTGFKNVGQNMGTLAGQLQPLASGGGSVLANNGRGAATSGTAETFLATYRVPANAVSIGQIFELTALLQSSSTGTFTPRIRVGTAGTIADALVNISGVSAAGTANSWVALKAYVYVISLGGTASVYSALEGQTTAAAFTSATAIAEAPGNVVVTAPWFITFAGTASVAGYTVRSMTMRPLN